MAHVARNMRNFNRIFTCLKRPSSTSIVATGLRVMTGTYLLTKIPVRVSCEEERLKPPDPSKLSHSYLIRNAASQTINSSITLLNQTLCALDETQSVYTQALEKLKALLEYNLVVLGDPLREDQVWVEIIKVKGEIIQLKKQKEDLEFLYNNAEKTLYAAAEAAFSAGADYVSTVANERLFSAKMTRDNISKKSLYLEAEIRQMEAETIEKTMEVQKKRQSDAKSQDNSDSQQYEEENYISQEEEDDSSVKS